MPTVSRQNDLADDEQFGRGSEPIFDLQDNDDKTDTYALYF